MYSNASYKKSPFLIKCTFLDVILTFVHAVSFPLSFKGILFGSIALVPHHLFIFHGCYASMSGSQAPNWCACLAPALKGPLAH